MIIKGNTVGTPMPRTNYEQTDPTKADYLKGKDVLDQKIEAAKKAGVDAATAANAHSTNKNNPHGTTAKQVGARPNTWLPTLDEIGAQVRHHSVTCKLSTTNWVNNVQTVNVDGVTESDTVIVTPAPDSFDAYAEAGVRCSAQGNGSLTFLCTDTPATVLNIHVILLGTSGIVSELPQAEGGSF